jgi:hypothetical protein
MATRKPQAQSVEVIRFRKKVVFSLPGEPSLTPDSTCGELVDRLTAMCLGEPEFLRHDSCRRYLQLLPNFREFVFSVSQGLRRDIYVAHEPLRAIRRAMEEWVFSHFDRGQHPILPSYALDLSQFIAHMIRGCDRHGWEGPSAFQVTPLVRLAEHDSLMNLEPDRRFKSDFTRKNKLGRVVCRVPANASVTIQHQTLFKTEEEFVFSVHRCYLSTGFSDYIEASCDEPARVDLQDEFQFFGGIEMEGGQGENPHRYHSTVPGHWIVAALVSNDRNPSETRLPVPFSP